LNNNETSSFPLKILPASDFFLTAVTFPTETGTEELQPALQVIGYVCGTLSTSNTLIHESMSLHETEGNLLCIHSVCVAEEHRRQGIGSKLMVAYVNFVKQGRPDVDTVRLLCKEHLVSV
jgi:ribosomal protein S18 acetylase RimI-like enzyme